MILEGTVSEKRGGHGIVTPTKTKAGWLVRRDITLGANVRDYDRCGK
jgi:hypothetical protein